MDNVFTRRKSEPSLYIKSNHQGETLIVCLYVDGRIYKGNFLLDNFKSAIKTKFKMTNLGLWINYFVNIKVEQFEKGIFICESKYAEYIFRMFYMINCRVVVTSIET